MTIGPIDEDLSPLTADASNLCKLVEDSLNGVAYPDDRLVQMLVVRKLPR